MVYFANPIILLIPVLVIPVVYSVFRKKESLRDVFTLTVFLVFMVLIYPFLFVFVNIGGNLSYLVSKIILFVALPLAGILWIERWSTWDVLRKIGVRKENLWRSLLYGIGALVVTVLIGTLVITTRQVDAAWEIIMFFEAFTEEFLFRGVLLLYLAKKTNIKIAYVTSILGFVIIHPQHFSSLFIFSTIAQAVLLAIVSVKTKNIIGPWVSHGLNRSIPNMIRVFLGV